MLRKLGEQLSNLVLLVSITGSDLVTKLWSVSIMYGFGFCLFWIINVSDVSIFRNVNLYPNIQTVLVVSFQSLYKILFTSILYSIIFITNHARNYFPFFKSFEATRHRKSLSLNDVICNPRVTNCYLKHEQQDRNMSKA